mgnify:FL=1
MRLCVRCGVPMVKTYSFSRKGNEKYLKCPKCHSETPHTKMRDKDFPTEYKERKDE